MATPDHNTALQPPTEPAAIVRAVTVIMGTVVGLTFLFGFGNVLNLALRLGVPAWVAPLVAPAVDLSILGLLLGTRHLALTGVSPDVLRPARRLLIFASVVTLALNIADPLVAGEYGKAAFDAVGPLLLIGWAEVGPGFLQAINASTTSTASHCVGGEAPNMQGAAQPEAGRHADHDAATVRESVRPTKQQRSLEALLIQARREDTAHRAIHQKPISADTLRVRLHIGAAQARRLVRVIRAEFQMHAVSDPPSPDTAEEVQRFDAVTV